MKKENIPNLITILRFIGTITLWFCAPLSVVFFVFYILCGITDVLDGFMARKLHATSELGAKLDSAADLVFYITMAVKILPFLIDRLSAVIWWIIAGIIMIRVVCYTLAFMKFKCFASLHTYMNKATGLVVYIMPYAIITPVFEVYKYIALLTALLASVEELFIHIVTKEYHTDVKSILCVKTY